VDIKHVRFSLTFTESIVKSTKHVEHRIEYARQIIIIPNDRSKCTLNAIIIIAMHLLCNNNV